MHLRHKKPENSYAGQANMESDGAVEEYYDEKITSRKKNKILNQSPPHDSACKYAQILVNFVNSINTDYHAYLKKFPIKDQSPNHPKLKDNSLATSPSKKNIYRNSLKRKQSSVSKQQLNYKKKNQTFDQQIIKPTLTRQQLSLRKQSQSLPSVPLPEKKIIAVQKPIPKRPQIDLTGEGNDPENKSHISVNIPIKTKPNQMIFGNSGSLASLNAINSVLLQNLQYQIPIYQQMLLQQLKNNPSLIYPQAYQTQNLLGMLNLHNFQAMQSYSLFSNLPYSFNNNEEKINQAKVVNSMNRNNVNQDICDKQDRNISKEFIKKKSCAHVTIAYHIHCEKLKQVGKLSPSYFSRNVQLSELDPTFVAKKFRRRRNPQALGNIPQSCSLKFQ